MTSLNVKLQSFCLFLACAVAFTAGSLSIAAANKSDIASHNGPRASGVTLMLGKAEMVNIGGEISDVLVADPSVVDVMAVKQNRLYLVGSALGDTNIMALDADGNILKKINVHVQMDTQRLQSMINNLYPNENVKVRAMSDQIVMTGNVSTPSVASKMSDLVGKFASDAGGNVAATDQLIVNMLGVRGEQQVMLRVKIVEASRSAIKNLGLNLQSLNGGNGDFGFNAATTGGLGLSAPQQMGSLLLNYNSGTFGDLSLLAQALEQEGIINTLAEPNLTAISGEQAGFLAGGEFPIPTQLDRNGNIVYEFRPFGVSLNFRPLVMSENRINLQLTTEVSTTSFDQNLQLNGVNVPTFNVRRAETNVELPSGATLMIAGLIKSDSLSNLTQLPGIGDVPVMGDLIKSDSFQRSESEVLVMITPFLVKPFAQASAVNPAAVLAPTTTGVAPLSALPREGDVTYAGPNVNYGALIPDDTNLSVLPAQATQRFSFKGKKTKIPDVLTKNLKRVYGKDAPQDLTKSNNGFGYVLE